MPTCTGRKANLTVSYPGAIPSDLASAAERYRDEPVVVLLDETAWRLLGDGSYEKRVHTVYQVNQAGAIRDLSRLSIIISPDTDRLESVRCAVINGTERVETSETRSQSLSDPESRLYYDVVAHVVNVPSLKPGSIISLRYSVKSRKIDDYAGYFGERAAAGGRYRVFKSNIVLAAPRDKEVYCHLKNIGSARLVKSVVNGLKVFRVRGDDIAPLLEETGMPHYSERLPSVTFTTHRNWDSMYRWYYGLLRNRMAPGSAMVRDLSAIIGPGDSPRERVRKILTMSPGGSATWASSSALAGSGPGAPGRPMCRAWVTARTSRWCSWRSSVRRASTPG